MVIVGVVSIVAPRGGGAAEHSKPPDFPIGAVPQIRKFSGDRSSTVKAPEHRRKMYCTWGF